MHNEASDSWHQGFSFRADHPPKETAEAQIRHVSNLLVPQFLLQRQPSKSIAPFLRTYSVQILHNSHYCICFMFGFRYVFCCSYAHNVAPKGKFIAFVSTEAEADKPEIELKPGIDLLGPVEETFFDIYDRYEPTNTADEDNCFVTNVSSANQQFLYSATLQYCWWAPSVLTELRCNYSFWDNGEGCACIVQQDHWEGNHMKNITKFNTEAYYY